MVTLGEVINVVGNNGVSAEEAAQLRGMGLGDNELALVEELFNEGIPNDDALVDLENLMGGNTESNDNLVDQVGEQLADGLESQAALQELYLDYSTVVEAMRIISEMVQKGIDVSENERQDISQAQE